MKKIALLLVFVMILGSCFALASCNSDTSTQPPSTSQKTNQEIELENALRLEQDGSWGGAYQLLNDLIERGYYPEYESKRDALKEKTLITEAVYNAFSYKNLKAQLKNPNSLVIYSISVKGDVYDGTEHFDIIFDYGATNSFGGMVRDTLETSYSTWQAKPYIGKTVDCSYIDLEDLAKLSSRELMDKLYGDFRLYHYNFADDEPGNIWND